MRRLGRAGLGRWPGRRVALAGLAGALLLSAVLLGQVTPLQAQEGGVSLQFDDLSDAPTHTTVDRFTVELRNLTATTTYEVRVVSDRAAALGIDGCGQAAQTRTVTGVTAQTLAFLVYACTEGDGTITATVRRAGASVSEATVSQRLTVTPLSAGVAEDAPVVQAAQAAQAQVARVGTPGIVPGVSFSNVTTTSFTVSWRAPSDNGRRLTGYGVLQWRDGTDRPPWGSASVVSGRSKTYGGLRPDTKYWVMVHACNDTDSCGWWTHPKSVRTKAAPPPPPTRTSTPTPRPPTPTRAPGRPDPPHTISVDQKKATSARVRWSAAANTGGVALTGFGILWWPDGTTEPSHDRAAVVGTNARTHTMTGLQPATTYRVKLRACNGPNRCSRWSSDHLFDTPKAPPPPPTLIPATQTIAIGDDAKVEAHDVPAGIDAVFRVSGPIQPRGRCPPGIAAAQSAGRGYYNSIWVTGCAPGGTGEVRLVERTNEANVLARATVTVTRVTWPSHIRNLRLTGQGNGALTLAWDAPQRTGGSPIVGYGVQYRRDGQAWASEVPAVRDTSGTGTTHTVTGLTNGQTYHLRVTPCNQAVGCLPWSEQAGSSHASVSGTPTGGVTAPGPVRDLDVIPGNGQLVVSWQEPENDGGAAITGYEVEYKEQTASAWTAWPHDGTGTTATITGRTNGTLHDVRVRACNHSARETARCSRTWQTASGTPQAAPQAPRPQNLNLTPLGDRRARLSWTWPGNKTPDAYRVTGRVFGLASEPSDTEQWHDVLPAFPYSEDEPNLIIELDRIVNNSVRGVLGLAHHGAYEIRAEAVFGTPPELLGDPDLRTYSPPSDQIIVIDTPITHATAFNASTPSQATLLQRPLNTILNDSSYAQVSTEFRYRKVGHERQPHTALFWKPTVYTPVNRQANWELGQVYGVQVVFTPSNTAKPPVYAARDAYVWPSSQSPGLRERVASFPYGWDAVTNRTYTYRICNHTLPQANRMNWHGFMRSAMGHWGTVTSGRIQAEFEAGDCEDYTPLVGRTLATAMKSINIIARDDVSAAEQQRIRNELKTRVSGMFESLAQMGYDFGRAVDSNSRINEVRMTNVDDNEGLLTAGAFPQISRNTRILGCAYRNPGCAAVSDGHADIFINHFWFAGAKLTQPSGFRFDHCLDSSGAPMKGVDVRLYRTLVHEVTHAFGINYPARFSWQEVTQRMHHPNSELSSVMASGAGLCGPTQLDRLAVHAKYQGQYP